MRYHPDQYAVRTSAKRGRIMDCGRRSGKTELAKRILVKRLRDKIPGCRKPIYICAAPTQEQAVEIFWEDLLDLIPGEWIAGGKRGPNVSYSRYRIKLRNGAVVRVVGLDKPHRIEGKYINGFIGDEWSDVKEGVFDMVIRPMLADYHGWYILCGVPKRQGAGARWFRKMCEKVSADKYPDSPLELAFLGYRRSEGNRRGPRHDAASRLRGAVRREVGQRGRRNLVRLHTGIQLACLPAARRSSDHRGPGL